MELVVPCLLQELIANGIWPADARTAMAQNLRPLVPPDNVHRFAQAENEIHLNPPPFQTVADYMREPSPPVLEFWHEYGALHQIVPNWALVIGDFGLGSDAPIILDYGRSASDPPVFRLRYNPDGSTEWVAGARNFSEFAYQIGLTGSAG